MTVAAALSAARRRKLWAVADIQDFLGFLRDNQGQEVKIEIGARADDLDDHDRPLAKLYGRLGPWRMVDDMDRPGRGAGWVPVGDQGHSVGFYVEGDRVGDVVVNDRGGKLRLADGQYIAVVPFPDR